MAWWIFQHVVTTAFLAMLVALVCRVTRIGPVARHALWVLVLIKFVTPPLVAWPWTLPDPLGLSRAEVAQVESGSPSTDIVPTQATFPVDTGAQDVIEAASPDVSVWPWIIALWMTGSLLLAGIEGIRLFRLTRRTRAALPAPPALTARVATLASRMGLAPVPIVLVDDARAPSVWGLIRPRILWPTTLGDEVPEVGTDGLLVHELAHVKRRDHLVGWIELAGGILWWWNPLFWSVRSALREQAELACDAWVISALPDGRRAYAEALLALSSEGSRPVPSSMAVVGISATTRRALERRLVMIMKGRTSLRLTFVGICSLAVVAVATLPTWAASPQVSQPPVAVAAPPAVPTPQATAAQTPTPVPPARLRSSSTPPVVQSPTRRAIVTQRPSVQPPPAAVVSLGRGRGNAMAGLPEAARVLADAFSKDQQTYLEEMMQKTSARRATFTAEMQRLQDELTKAGNLDDAVAVRDYLRTTAPAGERRGIVGGGRGGVVSPGATRGGVVGGRGGGGR
jgi:beta-lactamase regulating signal transducer with metallopeptidase domain